MRRNNARQSSSSSSSLSPMGIYHIHMSACLNNTQIDTSHHRVSEVCIFFAFHWRIGIPGVRASHTHTCRHARSHSLKCIRLTSFAFFAAIVIIIIIVGGDSSDDRRPTTTVCTYGCMGTNKTAPSIKTACTLQNTYDKKK